MTSGWKAEMTMKIVAIAVSVAVMALIACPAFAQMSGGHHRPDSTGTAAPPRPKVDEKAYREALKSIPEPKTKYDPWGKMR